MNRESGMQKKELHRSLTKSTKEEEECKKGDMEMEEIRGIKKR